MEKQEQYSRCDCLLLHAILEKEQENTEELCIKVINEHLDLAINDRVIDRTQGIGNPRNDGEKPIPVIIKLVRYNHGRLFLTVRKR